MDAADNSGTQEAKEKKRHFYTLTHRSFYVQTLLRTEVFTDRHFYT